MGMNPILFLLFFLSFFSFLGTGHAGSPDQKTLDRISSLPGQPPVSFEQFSGYVTVNEQHGRALFYWLTEAVGDSSTKPLVLWLNGEANILFVESPAGVGFSYTNTSSDLKDCGDERTAQDAFIFIIRWMSRFSEYRNRDFYISGESYAGHYVPQLAKKINDYNKNTKESFINLKGFLVGNAVTDYHYDNVGTVTYWWSHAMISDKTYRSIMTHCNFTSLQNSPACDLAINYAMNHEFGNVDQYSIYTPSCLPSSTNTTLLRLKNTLLRRRTYGYDPCTENYAEKYYNKPDVQRVLHANSTGIPYKWTACSDVLIKNWNDTEFSMMPIYKELIGAGLRIWVF